MRTLLPLLREPPAERARRFDGTPTFVFLGGLDFPPNRDGLTWFLRECRDPVLDGRPGLPAAARRPRLPTTCRRRREAWAGPGAAAGLGRRPRRDPAARRPGCISPLRIGSGIKIKVLEALARGLPVVATRHGVLGLDVGADDGCLVADDPGRAWPDCLAEAADPGTQRGAVGGRRGQLAAHRTRPRSSPPAYDEVLGLACPASRRSGVA